MSTRKNFRGVIPAVITPLNENGQINIEYLEKQISYLSNASVNGFFVCGGVGEGAYLSMHEKETMVTAVQAIANKNQFICLAIIKPSTREVIEEIKYFSKFKVDYIAAVTPFYYSMTQKDILWHYKMIAKESYAPIVIYNIPARTHNVLEFDTILALSEEKNIIGIKDSSGDFISFSNFLFSNSFNSFSFLQGEDYLCGPSFLCGTDGLISGLCNVRIEPFIEMNKAYECQNWLKIRELQSQINELYKIIHCCNDNIVAIKVALELSQRGTRWMHQKSITVSDVQTEKIKSILQDFDMKNINKVNSKN